MITRIKLIGILTVIVFISSLFQISASTDIISVTTDLEFDVVETPYHFYPTVAMYSSDEILVSGEYTSEIQNYSNTGSFQQLIDESPLTNTPKRVSLIADLNMYAIKDLTGMVSFFDISTGLSLVEEYQSFRNYAIDMQNGGYGFDTTHGGCVAFTTSGPKISVYDLNSNSFVSNYTSTGYHYQQLAISEDCSRIAYHQQIEHNSWENSILAIVNIEENMTLFSKTVNAYSQFEFTQNGDLLLSTRDGKISKIDPSTYQEVQIDTVSNSIANEMELHPVHNLISFYLGCDLFIYNAETEKIHQYANNQFCGNFGVDYSLDGTKLLTGAIKSDGQSSAMIIYDMEVQFDQSSSSSDQFDSATNSSFQSSSSEGNVSLYLTPILIGIMLRVIIKKFNKSVNKSISN